MKLNGVICMVGICVLTCLSPARAFAQNNAAAETLFRSAQEAAQQGDWETACDRFFESNRLDPAPGTVLNLARCSEELGRLASAWKYYKEAEEKLAEVDPRRAYASKKVVELEPTVPTVLFLRPSGDDGELEFRLSVNDTNYNMVMLGVPIPFDPSEISIKVEAEAHEPYTTTIDLASSDHISYQIEFGPLLKVDDPRSASADKESKKQRGLAIASFAVGGVGAVVAVFGGIWAGVELGTVNDPEHCVNGACDHEGANASRRGRTAVVLLGTGAAVCAIGAGLGTFLLLKNDEHALSLRPVPGGAMFSFGGNLPSLFDGKNL